MKPLAIDLYCGLDGWGEALVSEGYEVISFDISDQRAKFGYPRTPGIHLVLQDVLTLTGAQFKSIADRLRVIVASPPCQEPSYRAMPWKRADQLTRP